VNCLLSSYDLRLSEFSASSSNPAAADEMLGKISLVTWRGMLTKLMCAVYEADNVEQGRRGDGWEMNAMVVDVRRFFFSAEDFALESA
jgi:hypothetical protein